VRYVESIKLSLWRHLIKLKAFCIGWMEHHPERAEKNTSQCLGNTQKQFPAIDNWKLKILQRE